MERLLTFQRQLSQVSGGTHLVTWLLRHRLEFEQKGVPVEIFAVMPGAVSTDLNGHIQGDFVRTTENAAELILSFFFDDQNHNGQVINEDGSVVNYNPQH